MNLIKPVGALCFAGVISCDLRDPESHGACHDKSYLLATTAGSPSAMTCPHPDHRMQVQVATEPSNEEAAALVFCKCQRADEGAPK